MPTIINKLRQVPLSALALTAALFLIGRPVVSAEPSLLLPPAPNNMADGLVRVTYGPGLSGLGEAPEFSLFTVDILPAGGTLMSPTAPIPVGRYAAWCFDVMTDIDPAAGGTVYGGRLYSSTDPLVAFNQQLPNHPGIIQNAAAWRKINYLINHRSFPCYPLVLTSVPTMWEVQRAIWILFGQTPPIAPPNTAYPNYREDIVQCLINAANTNAANWQLSCGDKVAVIFNIKFNWDAAIDDVQLIFLEVPVGCNVGTGDTATIGFWHNKNGQALIRSVNGGPSATKLATWLATNFPCLFGANATSPRNLTGKTNTDVAALFLTLFNVTGAKTDAQILGGAIASYVTNSTLAGGTYAAPYGFNVSTNGTGWKTYNTGSYGTAIGLLNNTDYTVLQLLQQANLRRCQSLFDANAFNVIFDGINVKGDII